MAAMLFRGLPGLDRQHTKHKQSEAGASGARRRYQPMMLTLLLAHNSATTNNKTT